MTKKIFAHPLGVFFISALVALAALSAAQGVRDATLRQGGSQDLFGVEFHDRMEGGSRLLLERKNPYQSADGEGDRHAPSCLMLLWPYAALSLQAAKEGWAVSNLLFTAALLWALFDMFLKKNPPWVYVVVSCIFLTGTCWRSVVGNGEHIIFSLCFFVLAIRQLEKNTAVSGVLLALSFFKYHAIFPLLLYFVYKKKYFPLAVAFAIHLGLHLFASYWVGENPVTFLLQSIGTGSELLYKGQIDFFAISSQMGIPLPGYFPFILSGLLLLAIFWRSFNIRHCDDLLVLCALSLISVILVYHGTGDQAVLIFSLIYIFREGEGDLFLKVSTGICIFLSWYFNRILDALQFHEKMMSSGLGIVWQTYYLTESGIWYGAVICGLLLIGKVGGIPTLAQNPRVENPAGT
jgi:hypothetical protein